MLDKLDLKILRYMCKGVYSYHELAELCGVGRSTIYRKMDKLEKIGVVKRRIMALPDFEKMGFSAVTLGLDLKPRDMEKAISFIRTTHQAKFAWRTYGTHDLVVVIICDKDDVGSCIHNIKRMFEEINVIPMKLDVSVSIMWEKMYLVP